MKAQIIFVQYFVRSVMILWQWFYSINHTSVQFTREIFVDGLHTSWACIPFSVEGKWTCISALQLKLPVCSMAIPKFKFSSTDSFTSHALGCFPGDIIVIDFCNSWKREDIPINKPQQYKKQFYWTVDSLDSRSSSFCLEVLNVCFYVIIIDKQPFRFISSHLHGMGGSNRPPFLEHTILSHFLGK